MRVTVLSAMAFAMAGNVATALAADKADSRVEDRVEARLSQDGRLRDDKIKVDIDNGVAVLKGKVATAAQRERAERLARGVAGVTRVDNRLEIDTAVARDRIEHDADQAKQRIDDNAKRAKDRVDQNAERAKEHVENNASAVRSEDCRLDDRGTPVEHRANGVGEEVTDSWITTKVKGQMVGVDQLKGSDISVDTSHDGVVTLSGTVASDTARTRAIEIARATKGVRRVVDELKLRR